MKRKTKTVRRAWAMKRARAGVNVCMVCLGLIVAGCVGEDPEIIQDATPVDTIPMRGGSDTDVEPRAQMGSPEVEDDPQTEPGTGISPETDPHRPGAGGASTDPETAPAESHGGGSSDPEPQHSEAGGDARPDPAESDLDPPEGGAPEPGSGMNRLGNPSFEDGEEHWNLWGGAQRARGQAQDGEWAVMATRQNGAEQRVEGLEPNTTYRLSGWARTEGADPISIGVKDHGNPEQRLLFAEAEYTEQGLSFTTGFGRTTAVIYVYKHGAEGAGYADNLALTYESESAYELVWSDEFEGNGRPDPEKWVFEEGFVRNEELQWYQAENAFRENGYLVIEGRRTNRPNPNHIPGSDSWKTNRENIEYTSSSATTRGLFDWRYGRLVVRAKVTNFTGTWPAIWTLGTSCEWPSSGEVDIMENYGGNILANFAWGTDRRWTAQWDSSRWPVVDFEPQWTEEFHIWELEWSAETMRILLDGRELNTVDLATTTNGSSNCGGENPFQQPHYLLLNLALGSGGGPVDDLEFPTRYVVDYVRVYQ